MKKTRLIFLFIVISIFMLGCFASCNKKNEYQITFNTNGAGKEISTTITNENIEIPELEKSGYQFNGWYFDNNTFSEPFNENTNFDELQNSPKLDVTNYVYAKWDPIIFFIDYILNSGYMNNGSNPDTYTVEDNFVLQNPTREGYTFGGWYDNAVFANSAITHISVGTIGNKTFYAKWLPYDITYFFNGGIKNENSVPTYTGNSDIDLYNPTKNGYNFEGWYDNPDFKGEAITKISQGSTGDRDFYAKWSLITYNINYNTNSGTNDDNNISTYTVEDNFLFKNPTRRGYNFIEWKDENSQNSRNSIEQGTTGDLTLSAIWNVINYPINYFLENGTNSLENPNIYNIESNIIFKNPTKQGYVFLGWYNVNENIIYGIEPNNVGDKNIYAKWQKEIFTIDYVLNNGKNSIYNSNVYDVENVKELFAATRNNFIFKGWYLNSDFSGEEILQVPIEGNISNITLYAKFLDKYSIYYNLPEGAINNENNNIEFTKEDEIILFAPSREGYEFICWHSDENLQSEEVLSIPVGTEHSINIYPEWQKNQYSITYHLNDGNNSGNQTSYTIEDYVSLLSPEKNGNEFVGWYDNPNFVGSPITFIEMGTIGEKDFYARWELIQYKINYLLTDTNNENNPYSYTIEDNFVLFDPYKNGYKFIGWFTNQTFTQIITEITAGTQGEKTLYAKFLEKYSIEYIMPVDAINNINNPSFYTVDDEIVLKDPSKSEYKFCGWYEDNQCLGTQISTIPLGSQRNIILYAKFLIKYKINYHMTNSENSTNNPDFYTIEDNITLEDPAKLGCVFNGWYDSNLYTNKITSIDGEGQIDYELYPYFTPNTYSIYYFDVDNPLALIPNNYNVFDNIILENPIKDGYDFIGWYENELLEGEIIDQIPQGSTGNKYFYAKFLEKYSIVYNLPIGSDNSKNPDTFNSNDNITLYNAEKTGYNFVRWELNGVEITQINGMNQSITLDAIFSPINYNITYILNGGSTDNPSTYTIENEVQLSDATKDYYNFIEWYEDENYMGDPISNILLGSTGDKVFYALWEAKPYTINYELYGGINNSCNPITYTIEDEVEILVPSKNEHIFLGWYDQEIEGNIVEKLYLGSHGEKTLYAKWEIIVYNIVYNLDGGANPSENPITYTIEDNVVLSDPTKENYNFDGWYVFDTKGITSEKLLEDHIYPITSIENGTVGNKVFYARWLADPYYINYTLNGGINNINNPATYTRDDCIVLLSPTKTGYTFLGWYSTLDERVTVIEKGNSGVLNLYAKFSLTYNIEYILPNGATFNTTKNSYTFEDEDILLDEPNKSGCIFMGWYSNSEFTGDPITIIYHESTGEKVFHAKFLQQFSITYNLNAGINSEQNPSTYTSEDNIIFEDAYKDSYKFVGWYYNGEIITEIELGTTINLYLDAKFLFINNINYVMNGGTNNENNPEYFTVEDNITLLDATKTGYTFLNWYDNANFLGNPIINVGSSSSGLRNLYAKWEINTYCITYELNLGRNDNNNPYTYTIEEDIILLPASRINYQFKGWFDNEACNGDIVVNIENGSIGDKVFFAKWEATVFSIEYSLYNGVNSNNNPLSYTVESSTITLEQPTKNGATFIDWYDNSSFMGLPKNTINSGSFGNRRFFAKWELTNYTINYNLNDYINDENNPETYTVDDTINFLPAIKAFNTFIGWYGSSNFDGEIIDKISSCTGNLELYARFSPTYFINYYTNEGDNNENNPDSFTVLSANIELQNPTREYYNFINWYKEEDLTGEPVYIIAKGTENDINLYAKWSPIIYDINYHLNGGTNHSSNNETYTIISPYITIYSPTREGYEFNGWFNNENFEGNSITYILSGSFGDINLYASWNLKQYDIIYYINSGINSSENPNSYNIENDTISLFAPIKDYYEFENWYENEDFTGLPKTTIENGSTGNIDLYAKYIPIDYCISYHLFGGENNAANINTYTVEDTVEFQAPSRDYYQFENWYANENFYGNTISIIENGNGNLDIYAHWIPNKFNIEYNTNGGKNHLDNPTKYTIEDNIILQPASKALYNFMGWYDNQDFNNTPVSCIETGNHTNIMLYAKFLYSYQIAYYLNGGTNCNNPFSYTNEDEIVFNDPYREDYMFVGWYANPDFSGDKIEKILPESEGDISLYAKFLYTYKIVYNLNGGVNNEENVTMFTNEESIAFYDPIRSNYKFLGWYDNAEFKGERITYISANYNKNVILYARWGEWENYLYYGEYPQSLVEDETIIDSLNNELLVPNDQGYYIYNNKKYAKFVTAGSISVQNGFIEGNTYYFLVEPIKWKILYNNMGKAYLMSDLCLDTMAFNDLYENITWQDSSIRTWLNDYFYNQAFCGNTEHIIGINSSMSTNPIYGTINGGSTIENVTLLSIEESTNFEYGYSEDYFKEDSNRVGKVSDFARAKGAIVDEDENGLWWLRSMGSTTKYASFVGYDGNVYANGNNVVINGYSVRPIIEIDLYGNE